MMGRRVIRFVVLLVVVYGSLMACWPVLGKGYSRLYRTGANFLFGSFGSKGIVEFRESNEAVYDIEVRLYNVEHKEQNGAMKGIRIWQSSRHAGYMETAFLAALVIATPMPIRRKALALFCGLLLVHGFFVIMIAIYITKAFSSEPLSLFAIDEFWKQILYRVDGYVIDTACGFIVSIFIWVLVSFRRGDWAAIISGEQKSVRMPPRLVAKAKMARA
jgi:hypothetical protein